MEGILHTVDPSEALQEFTDAVIALDPENPVLAMFNAKDGARIVDGVIRELHLPSSNIAILPDLLGLFPELEVLNLENNTLSSLPKSFQDLHYLREVNLGMNRFEVLQNYFGKLQNLVSLDIRWNKLSSLPPTIYELRRLTTFNLFFNNFVYLDDRLSQLFSLEQLILEQNKLEELPDVFFNFPHLVELNVRRNQLVDLPPSLLEKRNLRCNLARNPDLHLSTALLSKLRKQNWDLLLD